MSTNQTFSFRVSVAERKQLTAQAKAEGFSNASDLVRSRVFGYSNSTPTSYAALADQMEQLQAEVKNVVPEAVSAARQVMAASTKEK